MQKANSVIHEAGPSQHRRRLRVYHLIMWARNILFRHQSCSTSGFWCSLDHDVAVDISDKKTLVPTSRWFALSQVAASIRPWHRRAPGHWQRSCCHHRCRRYSFHSHHHGINNWLFLRCSICATTVPDAREYVYKRQVIDIGLGRSPGISNINFNTENIDQSIALSLHQSWQQFHLQITNGEYETRHLVIASMALRVDRQHQIVFLPNFLWIESL